MNIEQHLSWNPQQPYNSLPILPPSIDIESKAVLRACISSRAALAELKQAVNKIPNQNILLNTIPMLEAQGSSEIENIVTTTDQLFKYAHNENAAEPAVKEALRYREALYHGVGALKQRPLCTSIAIEVCNMIKGIDIDIRKTVGTNLRNDSTNEVIYTPPVGEDHIRSLLSNWEYFIHNDTLDPLIRMAIAHYQFEAIHPFPDGNGRTGRILNLLLLVDKQLISEPILYISRYINNHKAEYYQLLLDVTRKSNWEAWVLFMLKSVEETAMWTLQKIDTICSLYTHTIEFVKEKLPKTYSRELVDIIFEQPYCRIHNIVERNIVKRQAAARYLQELTNIGVLVEFQFGKEKLFLHPKLMDLLVYDTTVFNHYSM